MSTTLNLPSRIQHEITELTSSVSGLIESFRRLQNPLVESQEKVPQATCQLDKISQQTEAAAHRMLDMVEQITQREDQVIAGLSSIQTMAASGNTTGIATLATELQNQASTNLNDAYTIMDALQFQDITSQQINHAASLLEDIEKKLQHILESIADDSVKATLRPMVRAKKIRAYDPHADMFDRRTQQADIDDLFSGNKSK